MFTWIRMYSSSPWSRNVLKYGFQYYRIRCCFIVLFFFPGKTSTKFVGHQLCAKQFAWCFEMKRRLLVICGCFWRLCSFSLTALPCMLLPVYLPDTTLLFLCWKKLQGSTSCKYKAQYVPRSHTHWWSPRFPFPPPRLLALAHILCVPSSWLSLELFPPFAWWGLPAPQGALQIFLLPENFPYSFLLGIILLVSSYSIPELTGIIFPPNGDNFWKKTFIFSHEEF